LAVIKSKLRQAKSNLLALWRFGGESQPSKQKKAKKKKKKKPRGTGREGEQLYKVQEKEKRAGRSEASRRAWGASST
jgi:hypothetical protein